MPGRGDRRDLAGTCARTTRTSARRTRRAAERTSSSNSRTRRRRRSSAARAGETAFGQSMTALNFLLSRAFARTLREGDEVVVTALDHDANVSPWLELAHDLGIVVHVAGADRGARARLRRSRREALRAHASRRVPGRRQLRGDGTRRATCRRARSSARARSPGPTPSTTRPTARSTSPHGTSTSSSARRTSSSARTWASRSGSASCSSRGGRTRCGLRRTSRSATGSSSGRASTSSSPGSSRPSTTWGRSAGMRCSRHERDLGERFLGGLPENVELYGLRGMEGRVPTFCFNVPGHSAGGRRDVPRRARGRRLARRLLRGRDDEAPRARGRRRSSRDRPLQHRRRGRPPARRARRSRVRLLVLGGPRFLGRAVADAAFARGHELTFFNRGQTNPELYPEVGAARR